MVPVTKFISEKELQERKESGVEEKPYDPTCLYDRLQKEKARKQEEWDSEHALKNRIHRLDDEETKHLEKLAQKNIDLELDSEREAENLIKEALLVAKSSTKTSCSKARLPLNRTGVTQNSQKNLLAGAISQKSESRKRPA
ncbi:hypothetical protein Ciccas_005208, partial [Cichlidogyrus casuarinus]